MKHHYCRVSPLRITENIAINCSNTSPLPFGCGSSLCNATEYGAIISAPGILVKDSILLD